MIYAVATVACLLCAGVFTIFTISTQNNAVGKRAVSFAPAKLKTTSEGNVVIMPQTSTTDNRVLANTERKKTTPELHVATLSDATPVVAERKQALEKTVTENVIISSNPTNNSYTNLKEEAAPIKPAKTANAPVSAPKIARLEIDADDVSINDAANIQTKDVAVTVTKNSPVRVKNTAAEVHTNSIKVADKARNTVKMDMKPSVSKALQQASITDLYWLVGNWKNETDTQTPFEAWKQDGAYELHGTGFALGNAGDTTLLETFRIKQEGNTLALYLPTDKTGTIYRYELQSYTAYTWRFMNDEMSFPQSVELHRLTKNNFMFTMQNNDTSTKKISTKRFQDAQAISSGNKRERKMTRLK